MGIIFEIQLRVPWEATALWTMEEALDLWGPDRPKYFLRQPLRAVVSNLGHVCHSWLSALKALKGVPSLLWSVLFLCPEPWTPEVEPGPQLVAVWQLVTESNLLCCCPGRFSSETYLFSFLHVTSLRKGTFVQLHFPLDFREIFSLENCAST